MGWGWVDGVKSRLKTISVQLRLKLGLSLAKRENEITEVPFSQMKVNLDEFSTEK